MAPEKLSATRLQTRVLYEHGGSLNACVLAPEAGLAVLGGDQLPDFPFGGGRPVHVLTQKTDRVLQGGCFDGPVGKGQAGGGGAAAAALDARGFGSGFKGAGAGTQKVGHVEGGVCYGSHSADVWGASISGDGRIAATCDLGGIVHLWETDSAKQRNTFSLSTRGADPVSVALSDDATSLLATDGSSLCLWDVRRGGNVSLARTPEPRIKKRLVACSLVGHCAAAAGEDGRVFLWDKREADVKTILEYHNGCVNGVSIAARNETCIVSAGSDRLVCVWDTRKPARPLSKLSGHASAVSACAVDAGGQRLVSAACDRTVRVWRDAQVEAEVSEHGGAVECCSISADGSTVLSVGKDGKALIHVLDSVRIKSEVEVEPAIVCAQDAKTPIDPVPMEGCTGAEASVQETEADPMGPQRDRPNPAHRRDASPQEERTSSHRRSSEQVGKDGSERGVRKDSELGSCTNETKARSAAHTSEFGQSPKKGSFTPPSKKAAAAAVAASPSPAAPVGAVASLSPNADQEVSNPVATIAAAGGSMATTVDSSDAPRDPHSIALAPAVFHQALISRGLKRGDGLIHSDAVEEIGSLFNDDVGILNALGEYAIAEELVSLDQSSDYRIREAEFMQCVRCVRRGLDAFQVRIWRDAFCRRAGGDDGLITLPQARQMVKAIAPSLGNPVTTDDVKTALDSVALPTRRLGINEWLAAVQKLTLTAL